MKCELPIFCKVLLTAICLWLVSAPALAQDEAKSVAVDKWSHVGVSSCAGSTCHSRNEATGIVVRQNEILTWRDNSAVSGAHARTYDILLTERSVNLAQRLGLGSAHEAPQCLSCHTDNVAPEKRGHNFKRSEGVGCESCHGGAEKWLAGHDNVGTAHSTNIKRGLLPLEDAKTRANVCLACHMGSEDSGQFVTHRMMAAGHPRMSFELDLFTALQRHHNEDVDYENRKTVQTGARIWAIGQAMMLKRQLSMYQNPRLNREGIFPELVFFDCLACHRTITDDPDWRPSVRLNPGRPDGRGKAVFNDSSMIMLLATARHIAPDLAPALDTQIRAYHKALNEDAAAQSRAAADLSHTADLMIARIDQTNFTREQTLDILDIIVTDTLTRRYTDYVAAEQAIMAVDTLLSSMIAAKQVARADVSEMRDEINIAYDAVETPNSYNQDQLTNALTAIHKRLKELR